MIIAIVAIVLLLAGGGFLLLNSSKTPANNSENSAAKTSQSVPEENKSAITSIKDALMSSASLSCDFTDKEGRKTTSYIKNGMVRADVMGSDDAEDNGSFLLRDKKMYFWNAKKQGFMSEAPDDYADKKEDVAENQGAEQKKDMLENMEKYKESCKQATVADSLFTVPSDVKFTDYSSMMKASGSKGTGAEPTIDQKKVEELMKQYAPQNAEQ